VRLTRSTGRRPPRAPSNGGSALLLFVGKRLLALAGVLFAVSILVFLLLYLTPGGPQIALLGVHGASPQQVAYIDREYHLNDSVFEQYILWLGHAIRLNLGRTVRTGEPVFSAVLTRAGLTLELILLAAIISVLVGIPLGLVGGLRTGSGEDRVIGLLGVVGLSAPAFATGLVLIYVFSVVWPVLPVFGAGSGALPRVQHLLLPALAMALGSTGLIIKQTRAAVRRVASQDYVAFAYARGLTGSVVMTRYILRNALIPVLTATGLVVSYLLWTAALVEVTFGLPGLGAFLVNSIDYKDIPAIQGSALFIAGCVGGVALIVDLLYMAADPRVRRERLGS
jgi:peptide/nickel transport system permease protein